MRRALPVLALLLWVMASLLWIHEGRLAAEGVYPAGSSYDTSPNGTSLARGYLAARGRTVDTLTRPLARANPPAGTVVFRFRPQPGADALGEWLPQADEDWVRRGGRLVVAVAGRYGRLEMAPAGGPTRSVFPRWPEAPGTPLRAFADLPPDAYALAVSGTSAVAARWPLGQGEVVLLSTPEALENAGLLRPGNLRLLEALAGTDRPLLFDEDIHGLGHDLHVLEVLGEWGLGPALMLAVLAFAIHAWRVRARLGPPDPEEEDTRSDAVDLVDSLGLLYERMMDRGEALRLYHEDLVRAVAAQTGLQGTALDHRVAELLGGVPVPHAGGAPPSLSVFQRQLAAHNEAFSRLARRRLGRAAEAP